MTQTSGRPDIQQLYQEAVGLHRAGDLDGADTLYARVLAHDRRHAGALQLRGVVRMQQGKPDEAVPLIQRSLDIEPRNPQALNNLGTALLDLKRVDEAIETLRLAVSVQPNSPDALGNLGRALRRRALHEEAIASYRKAIELAPTRAGLHSALGSTLSEAGKAEEALASHQKALELAPDRADYRNNYGHALRFAGRVDDAESNMRAAVELAPGEAEYHLGLGRVLHGKGSFDEAISQYREARDRGIGSRTIELSMLFYQNHSLNTDPLVALDDARRYAAKLSEGARPYTAHRNDPDPERRLRIGFVSADLRTHPVGRFLNAMMHEIDPAQFELFAYSHIDNDDPINLSLKRSIPNWRMTQNLRDDELAARIHKDRIDILVDLSGHTGGSRLAAFAYKPAPVAATWLGYFATTGFDVIDYVICNRWLVPEAEEQHWAEKPWRLPESHWCYSVPKLEAPVVDTPALTGAPFTFGSYNNLDKVNEHTIETWAKVVLAVPGSRLLLRSSIANPTIYQRTMDGLKKFGLPEDRFTIDSVTKTYAEHMISYGQLDIALDPFPYNGGTTTVEALYMGVPVLTLHGDRFSAHMAESNIRSAGIEGWVAADREDYVRLAVRHASDINALNNLRHSLRDRVLNSTLFDAKRFARTLEDGFRGMWRTWCASQPTSGRSRKATKSSPS